jgi:hypothetical protein
VDAAPPLWWDPGMWLVMLVVGGCGAEDDSAALVTETDADTDADADSDADSDTDSDTDTDTAASVTCPPGMLPIPPEDPLYCFDGWEVTITGNKGAKDQYAPGAEPASATVEAVAGVVPSVAVTWSQAEAICANTAVVNPDSGEVVGYKRLATSQEWQDAGDGVIGEGGTAWPWGDEADESRCAVVATSGPSTYSELQPTGSLPGCVSAWGVYDQIGNAWEWADSEIAMDVAAWAGAARGLHLDGEQIVIDDTGALSGLFVSIPGVTGHASVGTDGALVYEVDSATWSVGEAEAHGYLVQNVTGGPEMSELPVGLSRVSDDGVTAIASVRVFTEADGHHFPDKRGGAYYSGAGTDLHSPSYAHFYDFDGTITFRCVADPIVR